MNNRNNFFPGFLFLLIVAGIVFVVGWLPFHVKPGSCGILVSKTSGVYENPVESGKFDWRWERLLPTNSELRIFSLQDYVSRQYITGTLPSADIYRRQIEERPDFSYAVNLKVSLRMTPEGILNLVRNTDIKTQQDLNLILESKAASVSKMVVEYFLAEKEKDLNFSSNAVTQIELDALIQAEKDEFENIEVHEIIVLDAKLPDLHLYRQAKKAYEDYQFALNENITKNAAEQANLKMEQDRAMDRLEKLGELLQKYPQLHELVQKGDVDSIVNASKLLRE